uniref:Uncharacterized protein n=1 Tax=Rhipicephalus microplus TaxID=6941 RepID=A0A6G5AFQ5_RHIMP
MDRCLPWTLGALQQNTLDPVFRFMAALFCLVTFFFLGADQLPYQSIYTTTILHAYTIFWWYEKHAAINSRHQRSSNLADGNILQKPAQCVSILSRPDNFSVNYSFQERQRNV